MLECSKESGTKKGVKPDALPAQKEDANSHPGRICRFCGNGQMVQVMVLQK